MKAMEEKPSFKRVEVGLVPRDPEAVWDLKHQCQVATAKQLEVSQEET